MKVETPVQPAAFFSDDDSRYPGNLRKYWHPIALSEEVTETPARFILLEVPLVAYRWKDQVVVFRDLCVHRGAPLSLGTVTKDGCLRCPYHGWEYDTTGACVRIPAKPDGATIPGKARAFAFRAEDRYGLVWVALDEPVFNIPSFPGGEYDDPEWRCFFAFKEDWATSGGRILENFCDWSHLPFVHSGLLGREDNPRPTVAPSPVWEEEGGGEHRLGYSYEQLDESEVYGAAGALNIRREFVVYLPFMAHLCKIDPNGNKSLLSAVVSPRGPRTSTVYLWISRNHSFDTPDDTFREFSREIFAQDRRIVEMQRPEEIPVDLKEELHIKVPDAFSVEYRRVLQRIAEITPVSPI